MPGTPAHPPEFVMWRSLPPGSDLGWSRRWFGNEIDPRASFNVRGIGIREPMFNADVHRPIGTGDWLIMYFHSAARLARGARAPRSVPRTLVIWPPGAEQFYSWGGAPNVEPHSWMHVEGNWVADQIAENGLPTSRPLLVDDESLVVPAFQSLMDELDGNEQPDAIILRNLFQNWARALARGLGTKGANPSVPAALLAVRAHLDEHFTARPILGELAAIADMSRGHLCHRFRRHFGTTIGGYVIRKRMTMAERLLYDVDRRPGEIAAAVGYPDVVQFSKQFKKWFGVSPTAYRRERTVNGG